MKPGIPGAALTALLMTGCALNPLNPASDDLQREAFAGTERAAPSAMAVASAAATSDVEANSPASAIPIPAVYAGTGRFVHPQALERPRPAVAGESAVVLNFEDQPIEAVVKAILGDLLQVDYSVLPGVQGAISFSTAQPVARTEVLPILETLLSWTGNALVHEHGRYNIMPASHAVAGHVVPTLKAAAPAHGMAARLFPLRFVAAPEMAKLLAPFMQPDTVLLADPTRNVLVLAGTPDELANYHATIDTFDVDWVGGMSVGVFSLKHASANELLPALESVFGKESGTPVAGLIRFIAIERTGAVVVIATLPEHVARVGEWIERMDGSGGNEPRLFVYDLRNLPASDVARYIANVFGGTANGDQGGRVAPGFDAGSLNEGDGTGATPSQPDSEADFFEPPSPSADSSPGGGGPAAIRVTAVDANNQLMVRARPSEWAEVRKAIERLDAVPLQVQIETRLLEVVLTGEFRFGVQWYLEGLAGGNGEVTQPGNKQQWGLGGIVPATTVRPDTLFYSFINNDFSVKLQAMEYSGNTKILSAPSLVVVNNHKARIQVGNQIPVTQTFINTQSGSGQPVGQVTYKDTGVILDVRPRINPGGLVYLDVAQEVSRVDTTQTAPNLPIMKRRLSTQVAVQSGQTVLLGGLIREQDSDSSAGVPGLSRIPLIGGLFRNRQSINWRTELVVLITPKVITNGAEAKRVLDDYRRSFRSLQRLEQPVAERQPGPAPGKVPLQPLGNSDGKVAGDAS